MDCEHSGGRYTTVFFNDAKEGCAGLELHRGAEGASRQVAKIVYWDACGHFFLETFDFDVPVDIIEKLIAEAKTLIKTK